MTTPEAFIVKLTWISAPDPVTGFNLTPFELPPAKAYPVPPDMISMAVTAAPCASTIPVILLSSASPVAPELTFLPIGVTVFATATGNFNFLYRKRNIF